jgi:alcohol dehydrogenase class IV
MQEEYVEFEALNNLPKILDKYQAQKIFLVTGKASYAMSGAEEKINHLLKDKKIIHYKQISPNPHIEDVEHALQQLKASKADVVIAIGGGSIIDTAKACSILSTNIGKALDFVLGNKSLKNPGPTVIAIPTTSGTGSEATRYATIYVEHK